MENYERMIIPIQKIWQKREVYEDTLGLKNLS